MKNHSLLTLKNKKCCLTSFLFILIFSFLHITLLAQKSNSVNVSRAKFIIESLQDDLKRNFYSSHSREINFNTYFKSIEEEVYKAKSDDEVDALIAQALLDLGTTSTLYIPPRKNFNIDYGVEFKMIGEKCFLTRVKPSSDAAVKGLKPGDEIVTINKLTPTLSNLWKIKYFYDTVYPLPIVRVLIRRINEKELIPIDIEAKIKKFARQVDIFNYGDYYASIIKNNDDAFKGSAFQNIGNTLIWKISDFGSSELNIDNIMKKRNKSIDALIFDLRGSFFTGVNNLNESEKNIENLASYFFKAERPIAEIKGKKGTANLLKVKKQNQAPFDGKVFILIDSDTRGMAEVFARLMQIEKRAVIIGDKSSGLSSLGRYFGHTIDKADGFSFFGVYVTEGEIIMPDNNSIEGMGVLPDLQVIPSNLDLINMRDPVLAKAVELAGGKILPEEAGKLFIPQLNNK